MLVGKLLRPGGGGGGLPVTCGPPPRGRAWEKAISYLHSYERSPAPNPIHKNEIKSIYTCTDLPPNCLHFLLQRIANATGEDFCCNRERLMASAVHRLQRCSARMNLNPPRARAQTVAPCWGFRARRSVCARNRKQASKQARQPAGCMQKPAGGVQRVIGPASCDFFLKNALLPAKGASGSDGRRAR